MRSKRRKKKDKGREGSGEGKREGEEKEGEEKGDRKGRGKRRRDEEILVVLFGDRYFGFWPHLGCSWQNDIFSREGGSPFRVAREEIILSNETPYFSMG